MNTRTTFAAALGTALLIAGLSSCGDSTATFTSFTYTGQDERFSKQIDPSTQYINPILSGFYPDPSVCRKGDDYFLVNSTFAYFPGVPIFHSKDMVHWTQIGHVLDRPSQLNLDSLHIACGIYAPAISYNPHNDTFYMINTVVAGIGNFYVKTRDPFAGNWSDPILLPTVQGIDPSFLFDEDGKAYIVGNGDCPGEPEWEGHTAIWLYDFDYENDCVVGDRKLLVDGGVDKSTHPRWIEGPHLYNIDGKYYLMCAEGGTETGHSEVIFTSDSPYGPFVPHKINPILTQRDLPEERPEKVTSTGHADLIQDAQGNWWAVFLGCRPYEGDLYNTGRETFMTPVQWVDGAPVIMPKGKAVPTVVDIPSGNADPSGNVYAPGSEWNRLTGNFTWTDDFSGKTLDMKWIQLRTPRDQWWSLDGGLKLVPVDRSINDYGVNPAFMAVRQQHTDFTAETVMEFSPEGDALAGLAIFQNEKNNYVIGKQLIDGVPSVVLYRSDKEQGRRAVASAALEDSSAPLRLRIDNKGAECRFSYAEGNGQWQQIGEAQDSRILSTRYDGGFTGAVVGCYATAKGR